MRWCVCTTVLFFACVSAASDLPVQLLTKLYAECSQTDWQTCLKVKLLSNLEMLRGARDIQVTEGVVLVADTEDAEPGLNINKLEESLPRQTEARNLLLDSLIVDKLLNVASKYTLTWKLSNLQSAINEGRGKKNKSHGHHMLMMPIMMAAATFLPLALGALALLAGKALIVGKMALLLVTILGIRKLFGNSHEETDHQRAMKRISDYGMRLKTDLMAQKMAYGSHMTSNSPMVSEM